MEGDKEKAILALDYDDDDSSDEEEDEELFDNSKVDWRVKGNLLRGKDFLVSENGNCPRCQSNIIVFVIQDELFPMGDMPEILYNLLAKGKAVLWSSQDKQSCKKSPTFMCKGFCPPDPLGAGFNINWDTVNLTKLLRDLLKLNLAKAQKKLQDQANEKAKEEEGQDDDDDEKEIIRNMLAKEKEKDTGKPIVGPLRENESTPLATLSSSETSVSSSETVAATPVTSSTATASYPVSKDGSCPHCGSTNIRYIILIKDMNKDITLPPTLEKLLKLGKAFKMAKGANSPPSFQCCSCTYGFNLDWSATNLKKIFKLEYEATSSTTPTTTTAKTSSSTVSTSYQYQNYTATSYAKATSYASSAYPTSSYSSYAYAQPVMTSYTQPPLMSYSTPPVYGYAAPPPLMGGMAPPGMIPPVPMTSMAPPMTGMIPPVPMTSMGPPGMIPPPPMTSMAPPMTGMAIPPPMVHPPYGAAPMPFLGAPPQPYLGMPPQPYGPIQPQFTPPAPIMGSPQPFLGAPPNQFGPTPMLGGMPPGPSMYGLQPGDMVASNYPPANMPGNFPPGTMQGPGNFPPGTMQGPGNFPPGNFPPGSMQGPGTFPPGSMQGPGNFTPGTMQGPGNFSGKKKGVGPRLRVPSGKLRKQEKKWKGKWSKEQKGHGGNYGGYEQWSNDDVASQDNEGEEDTSEDLYDPAAATRFEELLNKIDGENDDEDHEDEKPPGEESQAEFEVAAFTPEVKPALDTLQHTVKNEPAPNIEKVQPNETAKTEPAPNTEKAQPKIETAKTEMLEKNESVKGNPEPLVEDITPVNNTTKVNSAPAKVSGSDSQASVTSEPESQESEGLEPSPTAAPRTKAARGRKRQAGGGRKKAANPRNTRAKKTVEDNVGSEDGTGNNNGTDGSTEVKKEGTDVLQEITGAEESMQEEGVEDIKPKRVTRARAQRRKK